MQEIPRRLERLNAPVECSGYAANREPTSRSSKLVELTRMPLSPGTKLGPYDVLGPIGAGGMGEVYRARDTRLDREVAIKVLPEVLARDPERLARFEREAKTLASLNHPNIAQIYGLEETGDTRALVMELIPGGAGSARPSGSYGHWLRTPNCGRARGGA